MPIERIERLDDARLGDYRAVSDPELLRRGDTFVAEGRQVVRTLLTASPYAVRSVLLTETAYNSLADVIEPRRPEITIFLVSAGSIEALTGFNIHRGCLAAGVRPERLALGRGWEPLRRARRLVVLEQVANADNMGGIFRNAAAFGVDAVVLGPNCCDPLYRKAIRVSMGAALRVPFCFADNWPDDLDAIRSAGFQLAALTPRESASEISAWAGGARVALLAGSEGHGLSDAALLHADVTLRIAMAPGIDSLNVATATGIALHACCGCR